MTNPILTVEVLSPTTEAYDRGKKFFYYRQIETLDDYLLISQDEPFIDHCHKETDGSWRITSAIGLDASLHLPSIGCTLQLSEVYEKITFPAERKEGE